MRKPPSNNGVSRFLDNAEATLDGDGTGYRDDAHVVEHALRLVIEHLRRMPGIEDGDINPSPASS